MLRTVGTHYLILNNNNIFDMKRFSFMLVFAAAVIFFACSKENGQESDGNVVRFVSEHPSQSKVTDTNFEVNDAIGVYITAAASDLQLGGNEMNNEKFIYNGSVWNSTRKMWWNEGLHNVYAYYPYIQSVNDVDNFTIRIRLLPMVSLADMRQVIFCGHHQ